MFTKILTITALTLTTATFANEMTFEVSTEMIEQIKKFESFSKCAYFDHKKNSIGYGSQRLEDNKPVPMTVKGKKFCITEERATKLLKRDVKYKSDLVVALIFDRDLTVNQEMIDALTSFTYNLGFGALSRSDLMDHLAEGKCKLAAKDMNKYVNASGKRLKGLVDRRKVESELLLKGCKELSSVYKDMKIKQNKGKKK
jgi:lysozyme